MSWYCDLEGPECYVETWRKSAKVHVCGDCRGHIVKGERYLHISGIWDGDPASFKRCADCQHLRCEIKKDTGDDNCMMLNGLFPWLQDAQPEPLNDPGHPWLRWKAMFNLVAVHRGSPRRLDTDTVTLTVPQP